MGARKIIQYKEDRCFGYRQCFGYHISSLCYADLQGWNNIIKHVACSYVFPKLNSNCGGWTSQEWSVVCREMYLFRFFLCPVVPKKIIIQNWLVAQSYALPSSATQPHHAHHAISWWQSDGQWEIHKNLRIELSRNFLVCSHQRSHALGSAVRGSLDLLEPATDLYQ